MKCCRCNSELSGGEGVTSQWLVMKPGVAEKSFVSADYVSGAETHLVSLNFEEVEQFHISVCEACVEANKKNERTKRARGHLFLLLTLIAVGMCFVDTDLIGLAVILFIVMGVFYGGCNSDWVGRQEAEKFFKAKWPDKVTGKNFDFPSPDTKCWLVNEISPGQGLRHVIREAQELLR